MYADHSPVSVQELEQRAKAEPIDPSKIRDVVVRVVKGPQESVLPDGTKIYEKALSDLHPAAQKIYKEELAHRPRVPTEGVKGFNGRQVCFVPQGDPPQPYRVEDGVMIIELMEMPYDYCTAHRLAYERGLMTDEEAKRYNPMLANVSRLVLTEIDGEEYVVGVEKVKGDLGEKEAHFGLTACGVAQKHLAASEEDPTKSAVIRALEEGDQKESGIKIKDTDPQPHIVVREDSIGMCNLVFKTRQSLSKVVGDWKNKLRKLGALAAKAGKSLPKISNLIKAKINFPGGLVLAKKDAHLDRRDKGFALAEGYIMRPGDNKFKAFEEPMDTRPYTEAICALAEEKATRDELVNVHSS